MFEFLRLVAWKKREAIILLSNFLVLCKCHLDLLFAANVATLARTALAEEFKAERFPLRVRRPIEPFDLLVHLTDECFVTRLPLKARIHDDQFYAARDQRTRASATACRIVVG